jgi:hypothetical protein
VTFDVDPEVDLDADAAPDLPLVDADGVALPVPDAARDSGLNPAQQSIIEVLGAPRHERPQFDPRLRAQLRAELEERLAGVAAEVPDGSSLWIGKRSLTSVHGCEGSYLADEAIDFVWTTVTALGTVAHKAIELSVHWRGDPAPGELVDEALARLIASTDRINEFLGAMTEGERAELRSGAVERVTMFLECFPPLKPHWRPVTESRLRADLCNDKIVLSGKVDLTVGRADGVRAGKVLLDLKTGGFSPSHRDDLRFYALLETIRIGVPPRLLASYYLDGGRLQEELVNEDVLATAIERVVRGAEAIAELKQGLREAVLRPGPPCRWCAVRATCAVGGAWIEEQTEREGW